MLSHNFGFFKFINLSALPKKSLKHITLPKAAVGLEEAC